MNALSTPRSDGQVRGRTWARPCGMGYRRAPIDHHQFNPEYLPSLPAGERSLSDRCAGPRRQTRAQGGVNPGYSRAIGHTRRIHLGRYFATLSEYCQFITATKAGLSAQQALALINPTDGPGRQAMSAQSEVVVHVSLSKSSLRPDHHGRSEKGWRYQKPVMRCPS